MAVPTGVPPDEQLVGAADCGPKTLIVMVPVEFEPDEPASTELIELGAIGELVLSVPGPVAVTVGLALAMDSVCLTEVRVPEAAVILGLPASESP